MKTLTVDLGDRSYPIYIGQDLISRSELYSEHIRGQQVMIVTNSTVAPLYQGSSKNGSEIIFSRYRNPTGWRKI